MCKKLDFGVSFPGWLLFSIWVILLSLSSASWLRETQVNVRHFSFFDSLNFILIIFKTRRESSDLCLECARHLAESWLVLSRGRLPMRWRGLEPVIRDFFHNIAQKRVYSILDSTHYPSECLRLFVPNAARVWENVNAPSIWSVVTMGVQVWKSAAVNSSAFVCIHSPALASQGRMLRSGCQ